MTATTQGIIIALLIAFLVGILVGYSVIQNRSKEQAAALKTTQHRLDELEQSHELRLRETTEQLRHDYEAELAATIEHYQDQLSQKTIEMAQVYETRWQVLQRAEMPTAIPTGVGSQGGGMGDRPPLTARGRVDIPVEETPATLSQPALLHLKKQYEMRLKEAAQKLQKACETQLAEHAKATRADLQAEFEQRLAEKFAECEQQFAQRQAELEAEYAAQAPLVPFGETMLPNRLDIPTPSQIMGIGDDTTMTLPPLGQPGNLAQRPAAAQYTQDQLEARLQETTEQLRAEYEQRLAAQLETQQEQFDLRLQDLEAEYKQKMAEMTAATPTTELATGDDLFGDDNNDDDDFGPLDLSDISQLT